MAEKHPAPSTLSTALHEAETIVEAARKRAGEILADAGVQADEIYREAYRDGHERGRAEAVDSAVHFIAEGAALSEKLSAEAAKLAIAICERVIGEHLQVAPDTVKRIAKEALQESMIGDFVAVISHPADSEILATILGELRRVTNGAEVVLESDSGMSRGGCIVRTSFGEVDASVESLVEALSSQLGIRRS